MASSSPSGRAAAQPAIPAATTTEVLAPPPVTVTQTTTTAAPVTTEVPPTATTTTTTTAAAAPPATGATAASEANTTAAELSDGDNFFLSGVILTVISGALTFGGVLQTPPLSNYIDLAERLDTGKGILPRMRTSLAFAYLVMIFGLITTYVTLRSLVLPARSRVSSGGAIITLNIFNICLGIIAACMFFTLPDTDYFPGQTTRNFIRATLITPILTYFLAIVCFIAARGRYGEKTDYPMFGPVVFEKRHELNQSTMFWVAILSTYALSFGVGSVYFLCWVLDTGSPISEWTTDMANTAFAFTLLFILTSVVACMFAILTLIPKTGVSTSTNVIVTAAMTGISFVLGVIAFAFQDTLIRGHSTVGQNYFFGMTQGFMCGGWIASLLAFIAAIAVYSVTYAEGACRDCALPEPAVEPPIDPVAEARKQVEIARLQLEAAEYRKRRQQLEGLSPV